MGTRNSWVPRGGTFADGGGGSYTPRGVNSGTVSGRSPNAGGGASLGRPAPREGGSQCLSRTPSGRGLVVVLSTGVFLGGQNSTVKMAPVPLGVPSREDWRASSLPLTFTVVIFKSAFSLPYQFCCISSGLSRILQRWLQGEPVSQSQYLCPLPQCGKPPSFRCGDRVPPCCCAVHFKIPGRWHCPPPFCDL